MARAPKALTEDTLEKRFLDLKFVELHDNLFLGGKNLGTKLDPTKVSGLQLAWDTQEKELIVSYGGEVSITSTNCKSKVPLDPKEFGINWVKEIQPPVSRVQTAGPIPMTRLPASAQVTDPTRGMK